MSCHSSSHLIPWVVKETVLYWQLQNQFPGSRFFITSYHLLSIVITPYPTLSPSLERKPFYVGNFKIISQAPDFYRILSRLVIPYHTLSPRLERKPFHVSNFKIRSQDLVVNTFFVGIKNSFPDRITRINFYQKYYQLLLHGMFPVKEKKLLVVGPADGGKTS